MNNKRVLCKECIRIAWALRTRHHILVHAPRIKFLLGEIIPPNKASGGKKNRTQVYKNEYIRRKI